MLALLLMVASMISIFIDYHGGHKIHVIDIFFFIISTTCVVAQLHNYRKLLDKYSNEGTHENHTPT